MKSGGFETKSVSQAADFYQVPEVEECLSAPDCVKEILGRSVSEDDHIGVAPNGNVVIRKIAGDLTKMTIVTPEGDVSESSWSITRWKTRHGSSESVQYLRGATLTRPLNNSSGVYDPKKVDQARECILKAEKK